MQDNSFIREVNLSAGMRETWRTMLAFRSASLIIGNEFTQCLRKPHNYQLESFRSGDFTGQEMGKVRDMTH